MTMTPREAADRLLDSFTEHTAMGDIDFKLYIEDWPTLNEAEKVLSMFRLISAQAGYSVWEGGDYEAGDAWFDASPIDCLSCAKVIAQETALGYQQQVVDRRSD